MGIRLCYFLMGLVLLLPAAPSVAQSIASSPEGLRLARELATLIEGDRKSVLRALGGPMIDMLQQMGVRQPDRALVLVEEVMLPVLSSRHDELLDIQAESYASVLKEDELRDALAFYNTPAGQSLIRVQPQLAQLKLTGMTRWISALRPELRSRIQQTVKTRGWERD